MAEDPLQPSDSWRLIGSAAHRYACLARQAQVRIFGLITVTPCGALGPNPSRGVAVAVLRCETGVLRSVVNCVAAAIYVLIFN